MKTIITILMLVILALLAKTVVLMYIAPVNAQELSTFGSWDSHGNFNHPGGKKKKNRKKHYEYEYEYEWDYDYGYEYEWRREARPEPKYNANPGPRPTIIPEEPEIMEVTTDETPGTVIIDTKGKSLYYVIDQYSVLRYPIAVGRKGFQWTGTEKVSRIEDWPAWNPPAEMRARQPGLPVRMEGGVNNPLGAVAIYLGNSLYRIHGSNDAKSIGTEASSGCFRMHNAHAVHLASLVTIGTVVKVF